jgi:cytochrome c
VRRHCATLVSLTAIVLACHSREVTAPEVCATSNGAATAASGPPHAPFRVLVFSRTTGYRHGSIPAGIAAIQVLGAFNNFGVDATEDPAAFTDVNLARFDAVIFLSTTGDVLDDAQQAAFERYIRAGHGFVGVHSASDTEYGWPWYHALLGATFASHPALQQGSVIVADTSQPSTRSLPEPWVRSDEWYNFTAPVTDVAVLVRVDESTYTGGTMGGIHPISWQRSFEGGRVWYTAMGHTACSYSERPFLDHLLGGIAWAVGIP